MYGDPSILLRFPTLFNAYTYFRVPVHETSLIDLPTEILPLMIVIRTILSPKFLVPRNMRVH
jgi:hypothetical protein